MAHSRGLVRRTAIGPENFPTLSTRDQGRFPEFLDEIHSSCCDMNYMFTIEKSKFVGRFGKWAGNAAFHTSTTTSCTTTTTRSR